MGHIDLSELRKMMAEMPNQARLGYGSIKRVEGQEEPERVCSVIQWSMKGVGFGELTIVQTPKGVFMETECMGPAFVKEVFLMLANVAILDTDKDPEKHKLYNEAMQRECSEDCRICYPRPKP